MIKYKYYRLYLNYQSSYLYLINNLKELEKINRIIVLRIFSTFLKHLIKFELWMYKDKMIDT